MVGQGSTSVAPETGRGLINGLENGLRAEQEAQAIKLGLIEVRLLPAFINTVQSDQRAVIGCKICHFDSKFKSAVFMNAMKYITVPIWDQGLKSSS